MIFYVASGGDVAECLDHVNSMAKNVIGKDIVVLFDVSDLVWPSVLSCGRYMAAIEQRLPSEELRGRTQGFAIVSRGMRKTLLSQVVLLARPETQPIFASSCGEASQRLRERFA